MKPAHLNWGEFPLCSAMYETCALKLGDFPPLPCMKPVHLNWGISPLCPPL